MTAFRLLLTGLLAVLALGLGGAAAAEESPSSSTSTETDDTDTGDSGEVTPLEKVNALVQPSVVLLQQTWSGYVYDTFNKQYLRNGKPFELVFQCTGFVVNPDGYIASAGHCVDFKEVEGSFIEAAAQWALANGYYASSTLSLNDVLGFDDYRVETQTKRNKADLAVQVGWGATASGIDTAEIRNARVISFRGSDKGDVALLKVEATDLNALPVSDEEVEVGTEVVAIGFPASVDTVTDPNLTPSFKEGSISSVKTVQGGVLPVYEISAAVSGGMSGGPSVDLDGEVVGVNSFGILGEPQAFNFLRPSSQLGELLAGAGVEASVSETTEAYRDGLEAYWDGDKEAAVAALEQVVDEQPSNSFAEDYLERAQDLPDPVAEEDEGSGFPVLIVVIVVVVVVVLAVVAVLVLVLSRRGRTKTPAPAAPVMAGMGAGPGGPYAAPQAGAAVPPTPPTPPAPYAAPPAAPMTPPPAPTAPMTPLSPPAPAAPPAAPAAPETREAPETPATPAPPPPAPEAAPPAPAADEPTPAPSPATPAEPSTEPTTPVPGTRFCGNCGAPSPAGKKFCSECGSPLD